MLTKICKQQSDMIGKHIDEKLTKIEQSVKLMVSEVKTNTEKIKHLEQKIDQLEQFTKLSNLVIYGIPESEAENFELIEEKLISLFKNKLDVIVSSSDIQQSYRIGKYQQAKVRPILVRFLSYKTKVIIHRKKKLLKNTGFVIKEDLTKTNIELMKQAITKYGFSNVWSENGRINALQGNIKHIIRNVNDLNI